MLKLTMNETDLQLGLFRWDCRLKINVFQKQQFPIDDWLRSL